MNSPVTLLGIEFTSRTHEHTRQLLREWLAEPVPQWHHVVTPNPEFLVRAWREPAFRKILQQAALRLPDGFGLSAGAKILWGRTLSRVTGVDATIMLAQLAVETGRSMYLLGGFGDTPHRAADALRRLAPGLQIVGADAGEGSVELVLQRIQTAQPVILLVAFGAPQQEYWLAAQQPALPSVRIGMGVGGTFDYLAGVVPRAPQAWQRVGMEWLYRLIHQPARWKRILTAVIIFPLLAFGDRAWQLVRGPQVR